MQGDDKGLIVVDEDPPAGGIMRWLPPVLVVGVIGGFLVLAWYAYHAGSQSLKDDDLLVVEADKTPMKEKPVDPGGMKFPNQDKTIFETFSGGNAPQARVERVLPSPEEPLPKDAGTETTTYISERLRRPQDAESRPGQPERVIGADEEAKTYSRTVVADVTKPDAAPRGGTDGAESYISAGAHAASHAAPEQKDTPAMLQQIVSASDAPVMLPPAEEPAEAPPESAKPVALSSDALPPGIAKARLKALPETVKPLAKPAAPVSPVPVKADGANAVQLGAYRSEKEARESWNKMLGKHAGLLSSRSPSIVKADLGTKGVYFRLRVPGFASTGDARAFCGKLSAQGQACMATGKP